MHRGFNYYYREGLQTSAAAIYRNKCFFRYILYFLAEFFGRVLVVFNPHFNIADMRQGFVIRKAEKLDFSSSFRDVGHRVPIGTYILTLCLEFLILIAGVVAVAILAVILGSIGYGVSKIASYSDYRLFILLFVAPAAPILGLYILVSLLIFSPTAYIIANNEGVSAGEAVGACYRSMINNGKMTVFLSYFVSCLIKSLYLGIMSVGGYFLITMLIPEDYVAITIIGLVVVSLAGYLTFAPILTLTNRVVKEHLFEDIVLDPATAARVNEKVNLSSCNGKKVQTELVPQNLASLFEYTEDPYRILEVTEKKSQQLCSVSKPVKKKKAAVKEAVQPPDDEQSKKAEPPKIIAEPQAATIPVSPKQAAKPVNN